MRHNITNSDLANVNGRDKKHQLHLDHNKPKVILFFPKKKKDNI